MQDELPPERFWFELGYGAAWADAFMASDQKPAWQMTDAAIDRAWDILPECYDGDAADLERNAWNARAYPALAAAQAEVARWKTAAQEAMVLIDEINERKASRAHYGIEQGLHGKLCTIRATLARAALVTP